MATNEITYLFFAPPNTPDTRDATIPHDQEVASLEGEHYTIGEQIKQLQERLETVTTELEQRQPAIRDAAREASIRREVEEDERQRQIDADAARAAEYGKEVQARLEADTTTAPAQG